MGEALLQRWLDERGMAAEVTSAGFLPSGVPATSPAVLTMAARGLDIEGHRSREVSSQLLDQSDLVITMTRQHLIDLVLMEPSSLSRTFQLTDLVRRAEKVGPRRPETAFADWLELVGDGRTRQGILAASLSDDIADPIGQSAAAYERTAVQLDDLLGRLAALL